MLFLVRLAFWMGIGLSALYLNGKLQGTEPSSARRASQDQGASFAGVRDAAIAYCSRHLSACIKDAGQLDALVATAGVAGAQPSPPVAPTHRR